MTPVERYRKALEDPEFSADPAQQQAVEYTQSLYELIMERRTKKQGFLVRIKNRWFGNRLPPIKGLYLWGGVGRGKTYIIDAFYESLPIVEKKRIHFHRFMQKVHHELKQLDDVRDPLQTVAANFAREASVICFDEFHVADITDAMLLGGLLKILFEQGVVLVTTSNEHPDQLYHDGLQRERFLPAIALLKENTHVINVDNGIDYRLRYLDKAEIYRYPLDEEADRMLLTHFQHIAPDQGRVNSTIEIEGRKIRTVRNADGVVWFEFRDICDGPRGPADYIEIGCQFQTVFVANVPSMGDEQNDQAKRFMIMVDEFYDRSVRLILTAVTLPEQIYSGKKWQKSFKRTVSRLIEMQSHDYLARRHLPE